MINWRCYHIELERSQKQINCEAQNDAETNSQIVKLTLMHFKNSSMSPAELYVVARPHEGIVDTDTQHYDRDKVLICEIFHLDH